MAEEEEEEEEKEEEDKEEREEEEDKVDSEEKEKSTSVFGWDLFAGLFVCIGGAEDTCETALPWSCSLVRFLHASTAASQLAVCAASTLFDFFSFFGMLPQRQRKTQKNR